ncbi:F0F1 ATP synthase subunit epsilon [Bifidobacterium psychraerophilum]|jgi:F-type H+-transporting ATPase subunit epsilon|uniref:ATP synthase subunit epsilon n=1 Tax=Bifidobacterium psychraerophilum TaxID=218140 RepID=A0A087CFK0_9BIFI|nr:F0F1 ATP synthase subunit epsilon [Bifidobacterium psychraerophilum]KFI82050.1 ATP synthase subunit epsilon [Bifidobacterium psychraerophilum]MCI1659674.1 F0F1 ATP synthase subunit epsilon [Bifidobacterium psychraerophilum]MCI1805534.1 F0F1 ATP synthase subunit epsilon [Bifidobacterium psychraerophilum]MCI2176082.1 F0F1 ATP synthase subunit epsilon [Bifidobacterium psychraerophilum]MCI2182670.1 F0F1 ATP synthase subunit epsilon [Bifidobacterium psychraerophilum]
MAGQEQSTMQVNIVASDRPVWSGTARSVTIPASEGGMGILPDHEPVLTVIREGTVTVTEAEGTQHAFQVNDGFIAFDSNKLTVAVERGSQVDEGQHE